jgi:hypothetical protein
MSTDSPSNSVSNGHNVPELATYMVPVQVTLKAADAAAAENVAHAIFSEAVAADQAAASSPIGPVLVSVATVGQVERVDG